MESFSSSSTFSSVSHGITQETSNLVYQDESGALNEA
jgi:Zn-dependent metalloprotease